MLVLIVVSRSGNRKGVGGLKGKKVLKSDKMDNKKDEMKSVRD